MVTENYKEKYEGMVFDSNLFGKVKITKYTNSKNVEVYWFDHDVTTKTQLTAILNGGIRPFKTNNAVGRLQPPPDPSEVLEKCKALHGDKYDYSETKFGYQKDTIEVKCNTHNMIFSTKQYGHSVAGTGCPLCAREVSRKPYDEWKSSLENTCMFSDINIEVLGEWIGKESRVQLSCHKGHTRNLKADCLKEVADCPVCIKELNAPLKEIVSLHKKKTEQLGRDAKKQEKLKVWYKEQAKKATLKFNGKYTYDLSDVFSRLNTFELKNSHKINITCDCGNVFNKTFLYHLSNNYGKGVGCTVCADYGYSYRDGSYLYLLVRDDGLFKVGITKDVDQRIRQANKNQTVKWKHFWSRRREGDLRPLEEKIVEYLNTVYEKPARDFDGVTESFILKGEIPLWTILDFIKIF